MNLDPRSSKLEIDYDALQVRRSDGVFPLKPRSFALLEFLIENTGRIVSKDEMINSVWNGRAVSDAALSAAIRDIRKALGDTGKESRLLRTYYGRGVKLNWSNAIQENLAHTPAHENIEKTTPAIVAVLPTDIPATDAKLSSIAQLKFDDFYEKLTKFNLLRFVSRLSFQSAFDEEARGDQVTRRLNADYVTQSTLRRTEDSFVLDVELIEVEDETLVWSQRYKPSLDATSDELDSLNATIATSIVTMIYEQESYRANAIPFESLTSWQCYCKGYSYLCAIRHEAQLEATKYLQRAIELDPYFADAYSALAYSLCNTRNIRDQNAETSSVMTPEIPVLDRALLAAKRALELDARGPFAWVALARCNTVLGDFDAALASLQKAISLNPNLGWAHLVQAMILLLHHAAEAALDSFESARRTSPQDSLQQIIMGGKSCALILLGQYEEAIECSRRAQLLPQATFLAHLGEVSALGYLGQLEAAETAIQRAKRAEPEFSIELIHRDFPETGAGARQKLIAGLRLAGMN